MNWKNTACDYELYKASYLEIRENMALQPVSVPSLWVEELYVQLYGKLAN